MQLLLYHCLAVKSPSAPNVGVLKEEDPVDISAHVPTKVVSKLDLPAVKRPPARYFHVGAATDLISNDMVVIKRAGR